MKKILFVLDKLELKYFEFNKLVTNFWMVKGLLERQNDVYVTIPSNLSLKADIPYTKCYKSFVQDDNIFYKNNSIEFQIDEFDLVIFRPDPPVDIDYINATYIFDFVKKAEVINSPRAIRDFNEKLHTVYFKEFMSENTVTSSLNDIEKFLALHKEIVLKPLNRCFGAGVMYLYEGDPNTRTIINTMTNNGTTLVMVQKYISEVKHGDKRVLTLGDKVLPYTIKKLPSNDDFKFNTHDDKFFAPANLSAEEVSNFSTVAKQLNSMGIKLAGLDVIDGKIIEINVTSPCYFINEINKLYNIHLEDEICNFILINNLLSL